MKILRATIFVLGQVLASVVVCAIALLFIWLPSVPRAKLIGIFARFNIFAVRVICNLRYEVSGAENIPEQPCVIIANHQSAWETLAFQLIFPPQSYILKRQLLFIPIFGWGLAANRPISISRDKPMRALTQIIKQGGRRLREGRSVVVFPEGTRMRPGRMGKFHIGGAALAADAGVQVLPVAHNAGKFWGRRQFIKTAGVIKVKIGKPINPTTAKEINATAEEWIRKAVGELG